VKAITYSNMQIYDGENGKHEVFVIIDIWCIKSTITNSLWNLLRCPSSPTTMLCILHSFLELWFLPMLHYTRMGISYWPVCLPVCLYVTRWYWVEMADRIKLVCFLAYRFPWLCLRDTKIPHSNISVLSSATLSQTSLVENLVTVFQPLVSAI